MEGFNLDLRLDVRQRWGRGYAHAALGPLLKPTANKMLTSLYCLLSLSHYRSLALSLHLSIGPSLYL